MSQPLMTVPRAQRVLAAVHNAQWELVSDDRPAPTRDRFVQVSCQYGKTWKITPEEVETVLDTPLSVLLKV